jgi:hypothetical protein
MTERKDESGTRTSEQVKIPARRSILLGSGALLVGGIAGRMSKAEAAPDPKVAAAPPLPWKWTRIDPLEAGTRTYQTYLRSKG